VVLVRYCACEILIANPIDWLYAACLDYFIFFSIDSSEARKQYDEYCLSIMQTITYAQDVGEVCIQCRLNAWARGAELCPEAHEHKGPMLIYVCCVLYVFLKFKH
jgi:hypothetical protein